MRLIGALVPLLAAVNLGLQIFINWKRRNDPAPVEPARRRRTRSFVRVVWWILGLTLVIVFAIIVISSLVSLFF